MTELPDKVRQMVLLDPSSIKKDKDLKNASKVMNSGKLKVTFYSPIIIYFGNITLEMDICGGQFWTLGASCLGLKLLNIVMSLS